MKGVESSSTKSKFAVWGLGIRVLDVLNSMDSTCISNVGLSSLLPRWLCTEVLGCVGTQKVASLPHVRTLYHANPRKGLRGNHAGTKKVASSGQPRHEGRAAAQDSPHRRCAVDHQVKKASVVSRNARSNRGGQQSWWTTTAATASHATLTHARSTRHGRRRRRLSFFRCGCTE